MYYSKYRLAHAIMRANDKKWTSRTRIAVIKSLIQVHTSLLEFGDMPKSLDTKIICTIEEISRFSVTSLLLIYKDEHIPEYLHD